MGLSVRHVRQRELLVSALTLTMLGISWHFLLSVFLSHALPQVLRKGLLPTLELTI